MRVCVCVCPSKKAPKALNSLKRHSTQAPRDVSCESKLVGESFRSLYSFLFAIQIGVIFFQSRRRRRRQFIWFSNAQLNSRSSLRELEKLEAIESVRAEI